jgi:hypothetical protein
VLRRQPSSLLRSPHSARAFRRPVDRACAVNAAVCP